MVDIQAYLGRLGLRTADAGYRNHIRHWREWYAGKVDGFHSYRTYNGVKWSNDERLSLGMAKMACEDWANLLFNERVAIAVKGEARQDALDAVMLDNDFRRRVNALVETSFALGTAGMAEFLDAAGRVRVSYYDANMIWPIAWVNGRVTECAFASTEFVDGRECVFLAMHRLGDGGTYRIENALLDIDTGAQLPLPPGVMPVAETGSAVPRFQLLSPNIQNNIGTASPLGISVYANALDQLKAVDIEYDGYVNEYLLGRKRLMVPMSMLERAQQAEGGSSLKFDPNDRVYVAYDATSLDGREKIEDFSAPLRADAYRVGLRDALNLLGIKCGFGTGRWDWDGQSGVKTATEVVSENSDLYQSVCKHELALDAFLRGFVAAAGDLLGWGEVPPDDVTVTFDDSIIQDRAAIRQDAMSEVGAGLMSKRWYLVNVRGLSETEADEELRAIREDGGVGQDAMDLFGVRTGEGGDG